MINFEQDLKEVKDAVVALKIKAAEHKVEVDSRLAKLDRVTDTVLGKVAASKYSWLWVSIYSCACFTLGGWIF